MAFIEKVLSHVGTNVSKDANTATNYHYYYNGTEYRSAGGNVYYFPNMLKLLAESVSSELQKIDGYSGTYEVITDTLNESTGFGTYDATYYLNNHNYKIRFYTTNANYSYNTVNAYNYVQFISTDSSVSRTLNIPWIPSVNGSSYAYISYRIYTNNNNLSLCIYNVNANYGQFQTGQNLFSGTMFDNLTNELFYNCFNIISITKGIPSDMTSFAARNVNTDTTNTYNVVTNLIVESDDYKTKIMKAYTTDLTYYLKDANVLSNNIKGLIKDSSGNKYICFGKFMYMYE